MKTERLHPQSLVLGAAAAVVALGMLGFSSPQKQKPTKWEFKVTEKHSERILADLSKEGWDYAGYFGASKLGGDEVRGLWKRPKE